MAPTVLATALRPDHTSCSSISPRCLPWGVLGSSELARSDTFSRGWADSPRGSVFFFCLSAFLSRHPCQVTPSRQSLCTDEVRHHNTRTSIVLAVWFPFADMFAQIAAGVTETCLVSSMRCSSLLFFCAAAHAAEACDYVDGDSGEGWSDTTTTSTSLGTFHGPFARETARPSQKRAGRVRRRPFGCVSSLRETGRGQRGRRALTMPACSSMMSIYTQERLTRALVRRDSSSTTAPMQLHLRLTAIAMVGQSATVMWKWTSTFLRVAQ